MTTHPSVLITGASTGIGAVYADRFAKRGHDLVLVARDRIRMEALADRLRRETGVAVDILRADVTDPRDLAQVEARLRDDHRIGILVNNAGTAAAAGFVDQSRTKSPGSSTSMRWRRFSSPEPLRRDSSRRGKAPSSTSARLPGLRRNTV